MKTKDALPDNPPVRNIVNQDGESRLRTKDT